MDNTETVIEAIAAVTHEANRRYCQLLGDHSHKPWEDAPEWQRESARNGVRAHIEHLQMTNECLSAKASHMLWMAEKVANGWTYGETKDEAAKTHPCLVPYDELPPAQRMKDFLFASTTRAMHRAVTFTE